MKNHFIVLKWPKEVVWMDWLQILDTIGGTSIYSKQFSYKETNYKIAEQGRFYIIECTHNSISFAFNDAWEAMTADTNSNQTLPFSAINYVNKLLELNIIEYAPKADRTKTF